MIDQTLKRFLRLLLNLGIFTMIVCFGLFAFIQHLGAAVAPNGQYGRCGPYYLWYQIGPDRGADYVDLCSITFDISDVVDDFDFVYFTDTMALKRALLDGNRDGISDRYLFEVSDGQITWELDGCLRIRQRGCERTKFNKNCGYAMISIQPKPGLRNGIATIPNRVTKRCPPNGFDCSETFTIFHKYSNCVTQSLPNFIVHKTVDQSFSRYTRPAFKYTVTVQNTGAEKRSTVLTDIITNGTNGGALVLSEIIIDCPTDATCSLLSITNEKIQISLLDIPGNEKATITYTRGVDAREVPEDEVSYFTNTASLSNGSSSQVTVGIEGKGYFPPGQRPERPRQGGVD